MTPEGLGSHGGLSLDLERWIGDEGENSEWEGWGMRGGFGGGGVAATAAGTPSGN